MKVKPPKVAGCQLNHNLSQTVRSKLDGKHIHLEWPSLKIDVINAPLCLIFKLGHKICRGNAAWMFAKNSDNIVCMRLLFIITISQCYSVGLDKFKAAVGFGGGA